jgi:hypothetical protein
MRSLAANPGQRRLLTPALTDLLWEGLTVLSGVLSFPFSFLSRTGRKPVAGDEPLSDTIRRNHVFAAGAENRWPPRRWDVNSDRRSPFSGILPRLVRARVDAKECASSPLGCDVP